MKRVVVTGMGAITPIGNTLNEYWQNLKKGVSGAAEITQFDASKFKTRFACEVKDYNPSDYFDRKEQRIYDKFTQFAIIASNEAIVQSVWWDNSGGRLLPVRNAVPEKDSHHGL